MTQVHVIKTVYQIKYQILRMITSVEIKYSRRLQNYESVGKLPPSTEVAQDSGIENKIHV